MAKQESKNGNSRFRERGLRKVPNQERSKKRVQQILSAATQLISESGYDAMTTNMIAEYASVPIGSLYQYFDSKEDIVAELCKSFQIQVASFIQANMTPELLKEDLQEFLNQLVLGIAKLQSSNKSFVCIFSGSQTDPVFNEFAKDLQSTLKNKLDEIFIQTWPWMPATSRERLLSVWTELASSFIASVRASSPEMREEILNDLRAVLYHFTVHKYPEISVKETINAGAHTKN